MTGNEREAERGWDLSMPAHDMQAARRVDTEY